MPSLVSPLSGVASKIINWAGPDTMIGPKTNWWKYLALGTTGAAVGIGAFGIFRPTYNTGGGNVNTTSGTDPFSSMLNSMMPILMMSMMLPMITGMMKPSTKKSEPNDDEE